VPIAGVSGFFIGQKQKEDLKMKRRLVSLLLTVALCLTLLPAAALAAETEPTTTVRVNFTSQAEGAFLHVPQMDVEVASDLAESYGFTDSVENGVSALDVLVKAHVVMLEDAFTADTASEYLVVEDGSIKKLFGTETTAAGFIINGGFPNDGVKGEYGYGGYNVAQAPVTENDFVEFLIYQDTDTWLDNIVWFCQNGKAVSEITAKPSSQVALTLKGLSYAFYGGNYADADAMHTQGGTAICGMQLAWADIETGTVTPIENCTTSSDDGSVTVTMPDTEGTYYLTVNGNATDDSENPAIMSLTKVTVTNTAPTPVVSCDLTALSVTNLTGDATKELTPSFSSDVTSYTTAEQAYSTNAMDISFKVLVTAAEGATVTAKLGETAVEYNKSMGGFVFNGTNTLKPGDNVVTLTVTNGSDTKTYTVTISMAANPTPVITTQPASVEVTQGAAANLTVAVTAPQDASLTYQWYTKSGNTTTAIDGATSATYAAPTDTLGATIYVCEVTNTVGGKAYKVTTDDATVTVKAAPPNTTITVPTDATLLVGSKTKHFVPFTEMKPVSTQDNQDGTTTYGFDLKNGDYNYRVSGEDYVTYTGKFKKAADDFTLTLTDTQLKPAGKTKTTVDRDLTANAGFNVADIYLNINPQGYLKLAQGDTHQLVHLRNWEAVDSTTGNYFTEPDYHYTVLKEDGTAGDTSVISISDSGLITANGNGTAIVLVTYDAFQYADAAGGPFFGALWPENTGVFVVGVGAGDSGITTDMTLNTGKNPTNTTAGKLSGDALDAEHDVIYFTGEQGSYTFTPATTDCTVTVANPTVTDAAMTFNGFVDTGVTTDENGAVTVPLKEGRNIVKVAKDGKAEYQVITAKQVTITGLPDFAVPGQALSFSFDKLYHPANKLAGVYNMSAMIRYTQVDGYDSAAIIGGASNQYKFASTETAQTVNAVLKKGGSAWMPSYTKDKDLTVPADYIGENFTLSGGCLFAFGFGDPYGNHRGITLTDGKAPNMNASVKEGYLGALPDITVPVTTLKSISVTTQPTRTAYHIGDSFDPAGMVVKAVYGNGKEVEVTDYTFTTDAFTTAGSATVTVSYTQGAATKSADVTVTVEEAALERIEITTPPTKTAYTALDAFDPAGMVVTAYYADNTTAVVTQYTVAPEELITTTTEVTVTYNGKTATVPVTVTGRVLSKIAVTKEPAKTQYTVGETFDPTGIEVTATYNDGTTQVVTDQVTYRNTSFESPSNNRYVEVNYTEGGETQRVLQKVKVVAATTDPDDPTPATITVSFTLLGDDHHDSDADGQVHTMKKKNLTEWIAERNYTVPADAKVIDVVTKALGLAGIAYENPDGNYITTIKGLGEFSNGQKSGWMYTLNGKHPDLGVAEQTLKDQDKIVFHYTDDYTQEQGSEDWGGGGSTSSGSTSTATPKDPKVEVTTDKTTGETTAAVELPKGVESAAVSIPAKDIAPNVELTGGNVLVIVDKDGTETVVKKSLVDGDTVKAILNGSCTVKVVDNTKEFTDTDAHWAKDSIAFAASHELFQGTGDKTFGPDLPMDRAMLATVLYRLEDAAAQGENPFDDVAQDAWYTDAVIWANAEKIVTGTGAGFAPQRPITRQEIVTMLYRYAKAVGLDTKQSADLKDYTDAGAVASWAKDAMEWAVAVGLVKGKTDTTLEPEANATRAEVATLMERMVKLLVD